MNEKNIRNLSPDFSISPGTQVVLTKNLQRDGKNKKAGSVGVVVKSSPDNVEPYLVRFADESQWPVEFSSLALRRREIDDLLSQHTDHESFRRHVIYSCQVGSRAFGLASENSDNDVRGIFLLPARSHWSLYKTPEQLEFQMDGNDEVYWELEKFIKLALKANPNILETLWTPVVLNSSPIADRLRESRAVFLSNHLYKTYSGYVLSQFRRMKNSFEKKGTFKNKHAMHLIRLLYSGIAALRTGEIMIDVSQHREQLLAVKSGAYSFQEVRELALELDKQFQQAFESTCLPDQPDVEAANEILIQARNFMVQKANDE